MIHPSDYFRAMCDPILVREPCYVVRALNFIDNRNTCSLFDIGTVVNSLKLPIDYVNVP